MKGDNEEFLACYIDENMDKLAEIETCILRMEEFGFDRESYETILRQLHTMKGTSGMFGFSIASDLCHELEETLRDGDVEKDIYSKVDTTLHFVNVMRSFTEKLPSESNEEVKSFLLDLQRDSWTTQPLDKAGIHLRTSKPVLEGAAVVLRPLCVKDNITLDDLHQDLIDIGESLFDRTLVLDLANFEGIPLRLIGWAFALNEELARNRSRLILAGIQPGAVSPSTKQKMERHFNIREESSRAVPPVVCGKIIE